jgi:hypothetical protein
MQADFSVELGGDAPALEIPWRSDDPRVRYYDLKIHPELVLQIPEAVAYPELGSFLSRINATGFPMATAKCDVWSSSEIASEEKIFGDRTFVSYVDLIFVNEKDRCSFEKNEEFAKELCRLLGHAPEIAATVELIIRHCYYHQENVVFETEAEQSGLQSSASETKPELSSPGNEDAVDQYAWAAVAPQNEHADVATHLEPAEVTDQEEFGDATHNNYFAGLTDDDERVNMTHHDKSDTSNERRQLNSQESETADSLDCDDSFKARPSGKSRTTPSGKGSSAQLERKGRWDRPNASVTGFCLTIYVTGFGDSEHDPVRRWTIGLNLLQHAIVQLSSNSQPKH